MNEEKPVLGLILSVIIVILSGFAVLTGLLHPQIYHQNSNALLPWIISRDILTLALGLPFLVITTCLAAGNSRRGYLTWMAALGYFIYTYGNYVFAIGSNQLFLVNLVLFACSIFALIAVLGQLDVESTGLWFLAKTPIYAIALLFWVSGLLMAAFWLKDLIPALLNSKFPAIPVVAGNMTMVTPVFDLGFISPLFLISGVWLWKRRPWGYTLTSLLLYQAATLGITILIKNWISLTQHQTVNLGLVYGVLLYTAIAIVLALLFLKNLREETLKSFNTRISGRFAR